MSQLQDFFNSMGYKAFYMNFQANMAKAQKLAYAEGLTSKEARKLLNETYKDELFDIHFDTEVYISKDNGKTFSKYTTKKGIYNIKAMRMALAMPKKASCELDQPIDVKVCSYFYMLFRHEGYIIALPIETFIQEIFDAEEAYQEYLSEKRAEEAYERYIDEKVSRQWASQPYKAIY